MSVYSPVPQSNERYPVGQFATAPSKDTRSSKDMLSAIAWGIGDFLFGAHAIERVTKGNGSWGDVGELGFAAASFFIPPLKLVKLAPKALKLIVKESYKALESDVPSIVARAEIDRTREMASKLLREPEAHRMFAKKYSNNVETIRPKTYYKATNEGTFVPNEVSSKSFYEVDEHPQELLDFFSDISKVDKNKERLAGARIAKAGEEKGSSAAQAVDTGVSSRGKELSAMMQDITKGRPISQLSKDELAEWKPLNNELKNILNMNRETRDWKSANTITQEGEDVAGGLGKTSSTEDSWDVADRSKLAKEEELDGLTVTDKKTTDPFSYDYEKGVSTKKFDVEGNEIPDASFYDTGAPEMINLTQKRNELYWRKRQHIEEVQRVAKSKGEKIPDESAIKVPKKLQDEIDNVEDALAPLSKQWDELNARSMEQKIDISPKDKALKEQLDKEFPTNKSGLPIGDEELMDKAMITIRHKATGEPRVAYSFFDEASGSNKWYERVVDSSAESKNGYKLVEIPKRDYIARPREIPNQLKTSSKELNEHVWLVNESNVLKNFLKKDKTNKEVSSMIEQMSTRMSELESKLSQAERIKSRKLAAVLRLEYKATKLREFKLGDLKDPLKKDKLQRDMLETRDEIRGAKENIKKDASIIRADKIKIYKFLNRLEKTITQKGRSIFGERLKVDKPSFESSTQITKGK